MELSAADQSFACNKSFALKKSPENHIRSCSSIPGIVYRFENQNILSFEIMLSS